MNTPPSRIAFDSSRAWADASGAVSANRDVLLALAGVFVVLPAFAVTVLLPFPVPQQGITPQAMVATWGEYYRSGWPALIVVALLQMIGTLAMLALFTDQTRPTVSQAIRQGFARTPTVIATQLLLGAAVGAMVLLPVALGGALRSPAFTLLAVLAALGLGIWAWVRLSLVAPAVMVDGLINPIAAIKRSWQITEGNVLRLLLFYALLIIAFVIVSLVLGGIIQLLLALVLGAEPAALAATLVTAVLQAAMRIYLVAVTASAHRQLAGPSAQALSSKFD